MPARLDILGLGVSTVDELIVLEHHPRPNEKQKILSRSRQCGGLTGSALVAAARMGCACGYLIALGTGELSAFLRAHLTGEGIRLFEDGSNPETEPYFAMILSEEGSGERSVLWDNSRSRAPAIGAAERSLALSAKCLFVDHVHAGAIVGLVGDARAAGVAVVGDFERTAPSSPELMALTNHIILPLAYARLAAGAPGASAAELAAYFAETPGRATACVTDGVNGSWYALGGSPGEVFHQPSFPAEPLVDTTGCGDVFHGVYCAGLVRGLPVRERFREASAAASLKARVRGAQSGAPSAASLQKFLLKH